MKGRTPAKGMPAVSFDEVTDVGSISYVERLRGRVTEVEGKFIRLETTLEHVQSDVSKTKDNVSQIKKDISDLSALARYTRSFVAIVTPLIAVTVAIVGLVLTKC